MLPEVIDAVRAVGLTVIDDLDGRAVGPPPDLSATLDLQRPADADGVLLDTRRLGAELRVAFTLRLRRGLAWAELRAAEIAHRLAIALPELQTDAVIVPPGGRVLADVGVVATARLRLLGQFSAGRFEQQAEIVEQLRTVGNALMMPTPGVDEVELPSSLDATPLEDVPLELLEADLRLHLDPLKPDAYRTAFGVMVRALRSARRRVDDDGTGRVADLLAQRDPQAADVRLVSYAGWSITRQPDALQASATFPVLF